MGLTPKRLFCILGFLACFLACVIDPQIHLWCDTCWLYRMAAWQPNLFDPHTCRCVHKHWWKFRAQIHDHPCRTQQAWRCKPLDHSGSAFFDLSFENVWFVLGLRLQVDNRLWRKQQYLEWHKCSGMRGYVSLRKTKLERSRLYKNCLKL